MESRHSEKKRGKRLQSLLVIRGKLHKLHFANSNI
jgi:hypothetical protein